MASSSRSSSFFVPFSTSSASKRAARAISPRDEYEMQRLSDSFVFAAVSRSTRSTACRPVGIKRVRSPRTCTTTPCCRRSAASRAMYSSSRSINAEISVGGRFQFSSEKAKSVRTSTPASIAPSTTSRTAFIPALWPKGRGSRRSAAQRPLPSMMIATWRGIGARMTDRDAAFLGELVNDFHQLFAAFLGQGWNRDADEVAIVRWREPQIRCENPLLDGLQQTSVPRLHGEELRFRRGHSRDLRQGHLVPVRLDAHQIEQRGGRLARPDRRELPLHRFDGLIHHLLRMFDVICEGASWGRRHWTIVPTRSPVRTRAVAPGWLMLNTTMGSLFSLHNPNALASITA